MSLIHRAFAFSIAVTAAASLVPAAFAQTAGTTAASYGDIQRTADLMNLMRTILDPNPAPVLVSPEERAVSGKTTADPASSIATTAPVVIMPAIGTPEKGSREPDKAVAGAEEPAQPAAAAASSRKQDADGDDPDPYPPFYYVFFFGDYVPYFDGWYYYSDRWLWGRRWPAPPEPPGWIPPPPPPRPRLLDPFLPNVSDSTIPVSPGAHRIPRKNETGGEPPPRNTTIPVAPSQHRFPSRVGQNPAPGNTTSIPVSPGAHRIPRANR